MYHSNGLRSLTFLVLGIGYTVAITCPDSTWVAFEGNCYTLGLNAYRNFYDAEMFCREDGAQLVHIDNAKENEFVKQNLQAIHSGEFWIGLTDYMTEGKWVYYANNHTVSFFDWNSGEPNSYQGAEEDCVGMLSTGNYTWFDVACDAYLQPICEMTASDSGTSVVG